MDDFKRRFYGKKAEQAIEIQFGEFLELHLDILRACHSMLSEDHTIEPSVRNRYIYINFILAHNVFWAIHKLVRIGFAFESLPLLRVLFEIHISFNYIFLNTDQTENRLEQGVAAFDKESLKNVKLHLKRLSKDISENQKRQFAETINDFRKRIAERGEENQQNLVEKWGSTWKKCEILDKENSDLSGFSNDYDLIYRYCSDIVHANPNRLSSKVRFDDAGLVYKPGPQVDEHLSLALVFSAKFFIYICHIVDTSLFEGKMFDYKSLVNRLKKLVGEDNK